ncbi:MAG: PAS domain-containing protein [Nitrospinae bacterium]|nr:PAS domain-containing protein [Nitrospinota bacterium]
MTEKKIQRIFGITVAGLVAFVVAIGLVFDSLGGSIERYMAQKFNEGQFRLAKHLKSHIIDHFGATQGMLQIFALRLAETGVTARLANGELNPASPILTQFAQNEVRPFMERSPTHLRFAITDASGRPLINMVNLGLGVKMVQAGVEGLFQPAGKLGERVPLISKPHEVTAVTGGRAELLRLIDVSVPLLYKGKTAGRLFLSVDMGFVENVISDYEKGKQSYDHRWIFDREGNLVYCSLVMSHEYHAGELAVLLNKEAGTYDLMAHGGTQRDLIATMPMELGENRWVIVSETGFNDVMGIVRNVQRMRTAVVLVLMLLVVAGGFMLYRMALGRLVAEEKARMGAALSAEENKYHMLIEADPDPIFILDAGLLITDVNTGAVNTLGKKSRDELLGAPFTELLGNADEFMENVRRLAGKEGTFTTEQVIAAAGGRALHFENNTALLRRKDGGSFIYQVYLRNVTDRREYELSLRREKENMDRIVSSVGAGIAVFLPGLQMEWSNSRYREIMALAEKVSDRRGNCLLCLVGKDEDCLALRAFSIGKTIKEEVSLTLGPGDTRHYFISATPVADAAGAVAQVIELVIDVTENRNLQAQLLQTEKLASIGEMATGIAHELNNPMAGIIGYSEFLLEELKGQEGPLRDVEKIHGEALRCSRIVQNLLRFSHRHQPRKTEVALNDVLRATTDIVEYEFKVNNVALEKDYAPGLRQIMGDQYQLQQVFMNILNNAFFFLKGQPGQRLIKISTFNDGGDVEARIWNSGPPIPDAMIDKVFTPFFTTKEVGKGTGLGLSVSHGIIKTHKGTITARNVDGGVLFTVRFPAAETKEG